MAASAAQVFTGVSGGRGDNSGRAAVLDSAPDFNADVFYQRLYERQRQEKLDKAKAAKDQQKAWADLSLEMPDVWSVDSPYLEKQLLDYDDYITNMKMNGADPENLYTPEGKEVRKRAMEMEKTRALIGENEAFYNDLVKKVDNDKEGVFDKAHATEFIRRYADPKLSPQDRAKMRMEENPLKLNVTETDFINAALPEKIQRGRTEMYDPESFEVIATDMISSPNGRMMYESLKQPGEDEATFVKRMRSQFEQMYKPSIKPSPSGGSSGGSGGSDKVNLSESIGEWDQLAQGEVNTIDVKKASTLDNLPAIGGIVDDNGTLIQFQPYRFVKLKDGSVKAIGTKYENKKKPSLDPNGEPEYEQVQSEVMIDYDKNADAFISQIGMDIRKRFKGGSKQGGKGAAKTNETKFKGVPEGGF